MTSAMTVRSPHWLPGPPHSRAGLSRPLPTALCGPCFYDEGGDRPGLGASQGLSVGVRAVGVPAPKPQAFATHTLTSPHDSLLGDGHPPQSYLVGQAAVAGRLGQEQPHQVCVATATGQHEGRGAFVVLQVDIRLAAQQRAYHVPTVVADPQHECCLAALQDHSDA